MYLLQVPINSSIFHAPGTWKNVYIFVQQCLFDTEQVSEQILGLL